MAADFIIPVRIYYEDTDAGGVVYHANYVKYLERARTDWLRAMGYEQDVLAAQEGVMFVVHSMQLDFLKPARFNESIQVSAAIAEYGKASLLFRQQIMRDAETLCHAEVKVAYLDAGSFKPRAIPLAMIKRFKQGAS